MASARELPEAGEPPDGGAATSRARPALGASLLVAAAGTSAAAFFGAGNPSLRPWPVLALWLGSIALVLAGGRALTAAAPARGARLGRGEVAFLLGVTVAALLARTIALGSVPHNFSGDEGEMGSFAREVLAGNVTDPFTTGWLGHPTLWFFLQALSLDLFGNTVVGLRLLSALLGAAAVPVLYVFAREPFGRTVAGAAAVLLAVFHFHVHYSRIGLNNVADPLLMLVALTALLRGLRTSSPLPFAVAGITAGVAQHFYFGSRLLPVVIVAVVVHQALVRRAILARAHRGLLLALLGFAIGYGPGLRVPLYQWDDFNARLASVGLFQSGWFDERRALGESTAEILGGQAARALGAFTHVADRSAHYFSGMPLLDRFSSVFFLVGLVLTLLAWRRAESAALLAWLGGTALAGGVLIVDPPQSPRYVTAAPALCLLVSIAIVRCAALSRHVGPRVRHPTRWALAGLVGILIIANVNFYFRVYSPTNRYAWRQGEELTAVGRYLEARGEGSFAFFFGAPWTYFTAGTIRFLAPEAEGVDVLEQGKRPDDVPVSPDGRPPLLLFMPQRFAELDVVRRRHDDGVVRSFASRVDGAPLFLAFEPVRRPDPR